jgi:glutamate racemase
MNKQKSFPIGVFDSGLGGLTVVKAMMNFLPNEDIVYFGDTARVPYGTKSPEAIIRFSQENARVLLRHKVKMIVIACNSSASYALHILRKKFNVPIVGVIEPGVKKAVSVTRNKRIGVIATPATINSQAYRREIKKYDRKIEVAGQPCPLFVPLVEEGWLDRKVTFEVAAEYLGKMKSARIDTLILGCTHYPLLKPVLKRVMGPRVKLVDSAQEVAFEVQAVLQSTGNARTTPRRASYRFLVSDRPQHFRLAARKFLGYDIRSVKRIIN